MSAVSRHYVLAAGGTGGHLIPAFALAGELEKRGHHVALITDERGAALPGRPATLTAHVLPAGRIAGMDTKGPTQIIRAQVPMSEMLSYQNDLISMTQGRASFTMEFSHYDYVPQQQAEKIIAAAKAAKTGVPTGAAQSTPL